MSLKIIKCKCNEKDCKVKLTVLKSAIINRIGITIEDDRNVKGFIRLDRTDAAALIEELKKFVEGQK